MPNGGYVGVFWKIFELPKRVTSVKTAIFFVKIMFALDKLRDLSILPGVSVFIIATMYTEFTLFCPRLYASQFGFHPAHPVSFLSKNYAESVSTLQIL